MLWNVDLEGTFSREVTVSVTFRELYLKTVAKLVHKHLSYFLG